MARQDLNSPNNKGLSFYVIRCCGCWLLPDLEHWTRDKSKAGVFSWAKMDFLTTELVKRGKYTTSSMVQNGRF